MIDDLKIKNPADGIRPMIQPKQVLERVKISRSTLFRLERDGLFPKGVPITPHCKLWFLDEVLAWQETVRDPSSTLAQIMRSRAAKKKR